MMTIQHTPGPWRVFDEKWGIGVTAPKCADIAHCGGFDTYRPGDEERANARLIAAAPELLAALEMMTWWVGNRRGAEHCMTLSRAAIAKARGE